MRKALSILLAVCLLAGCLPLASLATEGGPSLGGKVGFENFPRDFRQSLIDFGAGPNGELKLPIEEIQKVFPEAEDQRPTQTQWIYAVVRDLPADVRDRYCVDVTLNGKQLARFAPSDPKSHSWWLDVEDGPTLIVGYFDNNDMSTGTLSLQLKDGEEPSGSPVTLEIGRLIFIVDEQPVGIVYGQSGESAALLEYTTDDGKTVKTWRGEDGKPIANPTDFPKGEMACVGSFEDDDQRPPQLFVYWGFDQVGWNDELDKPIFRYEPDRPYDGGMGMLPIDERTGAFAIQTGEDQFQFVPVSDVTVSAGAHFTAVDPAQMDDDSKSYAPYVGTLTIDNFDEEYTISYKSGNDVYELHFDSSTYGIHLYSRPELDNKYLINSCPYNVLGEQPAVYLGLKMLPEWDGVRRLGPVELEEGIKDYFTLEKINDNFWKITLKKEFMLDFDHLMQVICEWEDKQDDGSWVLEGWKDSRGMGFWPEETIAYSTTDLFNGEEYLPLYDVKDKVSINLDMTVGSEKEIYPLWVGTKEIDGREQWYIEPISNFAIDTRDPSVVKTDVVDREPALASKRSTKIIASGTGTAELRYSYQEIGILDEDTGEYIGNGEDWPEYLMKKYPGLGEYETDWNFDVQSKVESDGTRYNNLVITTNDGREIVHPMHFRRFDIIPEWPEHGITVKVNPAVNFTDVKSGAYYADAVTWAVENNVTLGTGGNKFNPDGKCTRDQIVTFLYRAKNKPEVTITSQFTDMPANEEFQRAISWAVKEGVTQGVGGGKFGPGQTCTRVQAVTFLWRAAGSPEPNSIAAFSDMPSYSDFRKAISWAAENNITTGAGGNKFDPEATCSRGQIVTFLYRAKNLK